MLRSQFNSRGEDFIPGAAVPGSADDRPARDLARLRPVTAVLDTLEAMRAVLTAVVAAIEASAVALAGFVLVAVPVLLLWWLSFDLAAEPEAAAAAASGIWLLAHFVPMSVGFDAETALGLGLAPEALSFTISLAPLGLTLLTVLLAFRAGWRFAGRGGQGATGVLGGTLGFAAAAFAIVALCAPSLGAPVWAAVLLPALCFAVGIGGGFLWRSVADAQDWWLVAVRRLQRAVRQIAPSAAAALPARTLEVLRLTAAALAALLGLAALGLILAMIAGYVEIVTLSQSLQLDPLGAVVLFLLNLLLLPTISIWIVAWFSGAGFALGSGSSVSPFETLLGPVPALPLFGAIPQGWGWAAALAPLLIVMIGVTLGALSGPALRRASLVRAVAVPVAAAVLVGLVLVALSALASGAIGPGRMAETGPEPWLVGGLVAAELAVGLVLGVLARRADLARFGMPGSIETALRETPADTAEQSARSAADRPSPAAGSALPLAEAETVPIEPLTAPSRAEAPSALRTSAEAEAAPSEAVPINTAPARTAPADTVPVGTAPVSPAPAPEEIPPGADAETILRAYAWDPGAAEIEADRPAKPPRWRFPRRRG